MCSKFQPICSWHLIDKNEMHSKTFKMKSVHQLSTNHKINEINQRKTQNIPSAMLHAFYINQTIPCKSYFLPTHFM